ncbi:uncharacterized protein OCT59_026647 [Rhizophagus irregularis]|uniref:uncharacterized protein n=1 Tax=Rhizophagus irregularis TaxID=588596 RepID=UPI003325A601|nr:hypothetical protein OCT59_026647 [Rhizophagus irregularis]
MKFSLSPKSSNSGAANHSSSAEVSSFKSSLWSSSIGELKPVSLLSSSSINTSLTADSTALNFSFLSHLVGM